MAESKASIFKIPLFGIGFRPFFLGGCVSAVLSLSIWVLAFVFGKSYFACDLFWHAHEMIYGFFSAIIIGFLYTASQNWTGMRGIHERKLAMVFILWLSGRITFLIPSIDSYLRAVLDLAFLPIAVVLLFPYLAHKSQKRNIVLLVLPLLIWLGNLGFHLERLEIISNQLRNSLHFSTFIIVSINLLIAGRVIPFFSGNVISGYQKRNLGAFGIVPVLASVLFAISYFVDPSSIISKGFAFLAGLSCFIHLTIWFHRQVLRIPMLWVLYVAYAWFAFGYVAFAFSDQGIFSISTTLHAFTAGGISTMILGMISRVSLGHSGRKIESSMIIITSFSFITAAALVRVFGPALLSSNYIQVMSISGSLWIAAFFLYLVKYTPILLAPRADGKLG